jgi:hypothetical protein
MGHTRLASIGRKRYRCGAHVLAFIKKTAIISGVILRLFRAVYLGVDEQLQSPLRTLLVESTISSKAVAGQSRERSL